MSAIKWIFGGLGFVMGGPIGAILGVVLAGLFDSPKKRLDYEEQDAYSQHEAYMRREQQRQEQQRQRRGATAGDVRVSLLILIACVMKADGRLKRAELDMVKQFLVRNYGEQGTLQLLQVLKRLLEQDIEPEAVAQQIAQNVNYSTRLELVHFLLELAASDGQFDEAEKRMVDRIAHSLHLSAADYQSLLSLYQKQENPNWAYQALQIEPTSSDDEVKKAYRRMAMKYHPDKVASAGEEIKQKATEKFRAINEAYEAIKKQRGMA